MTGNLSDADESRLVAALRRGDEAAFDEAYTRYRPRVYSFLARLGGDPALAEDLLQDTFMRLARSSPVLVPDTRLSAWLFTVARNLFVSHKRWAILDLGRLAELRLWEMVSGAVPTPFTAAAGSETERLLEAGLATLPVAHREVLLLVAVEGMSPAEAASVLGETPEAVRQRLSRARGMLRTYLEDHERAPRAPRAPSARARSSGQ